jgi:hypothetical protein
VPQEQVRLKLANALYEFGLNVVESREKDNACRKEDRILPLECGVRGLGQLKTL